MDYDADLLMMGKPRHRRVSATCSWASRPPRVSGLANPYYNNYYSYGELIRPGRSPTAFLRDAYGEADETLALGRVS